jgi:hypothetical protein
MNDAFILGAIHGKKNIRIMSPRNEENLYRLDTVTGRQSTVFGREMIAITESRKYSFIEYRDVAQPPLEGNENPFSKKYSAASVSAVASDTNPRRAEVAEFNEPGEHKFFSLVAYFNSREEFDAMEINKIRDKLGKEVTEHRTGLPDCFSPPPPSSSKVATVEIATSFIDTLGVSFEKTKDLFDVGPGTPCNNFGFFKWPVQQECKEQVNSQYDMEFVATEKF